MCEYNWQTIQFTCQGEFLEPYLIKACATPSKECNKPHNHNFPRHGAGKLVSTVKCKPNCAATSPHVVLDPPAKFPRLKPGALHTQA